MITEQRLRPQPAADEVLSLHLGLGFRAVHTGAYRSLGLVATTTDSLLLLRDYDKH